MVGGIRLPEERQVAFRQDFRGALHHAQHVVVGHIEHFAHLQSGRSEGRTINGESVRIDVHVVHRADQASIRRECGGAVDQVEPVVVSMFLKHARGARPFAFRVFRNGDGEGFDLVAIVVGEAVFRVTHGGDRLSYMDGEHLIVLLEAVLHKDDRIVAFTPAYGGQIFVGFMVPLHFVGDCPVAAVVAVVAEFQQGQPHVGIGGQRLRIAVGLRRIGWIRGVRQMPDRFGGFVVGFEEHVFGVG